METLARAAGAVATLFLAAMVVVLAATLLGRPFGWLVPSSEEIVTFLMVGMAFFGLAYAYVEGAHVRVQALQRRLPARLQRGVELASHVGAAVLCGTIAYRSGRLSWLALQFNDLSDGLIPIPMWIPMATVPVGFGLFALALLRDTVRLAKGQEIRRDADEKDEAAALVQSSREGKPS